MNQEQEQKKDNNGEIDLSKSFDKGGKFQEEKQSPRYFFRPGTPKIIQWMMKYSGGLIKDEKQAGYVIFGFIVLAIIISLFLILGNLGGPDIPPKALEQPEYGLPIKD
ncbi:hypothetical protein KKF60_01910 [Patescibacteria group bacterium]|nr:hypothetical protein [Patescibacteria group bacterium]MBU4458634.1 hypothetical protein [Patescibacteria group bacterium]MCG2695960.1 hypothetical protein [Candidatus Portnoybacteria bacterium]